MVADRIAKVGAYLVGSRLEGQSILGVRQDVRLFKCTGEFHASGSDYLRVDTWFLVGDIARVSTKSKN